MEDYSTLTQCNNAVWVHEKEKIHGFIKVYNHHYTQEVILYNYLEKPYIDDNGLPVHYLKFLEVDSEHPHFTTDPDFKIIPRDTDTYRDWKAGDLIQNDPDSANYERYEILRVIPNAFDDRNDVYILKK